MQGSGLRAQRAGQGDPLDLCVCVFFVFCFPWCGMARMYDLV